MPDPGITVRGKSRTKATSSAPDEAKVRRIVRAHVCEPLRDSDNIRSVQLAREDGEWGLYIYVRDTSRAAYEPIVAALTDMQVALHRDAPGSLVGEHIHAEEYALDEPGRLVLLKR